MSKSAALDRRLYRRSDNAMQGFITERELTQADQEFPGIAQFFAALAVKPRTFLELVARFDHWCADLDRRPSAACAPLSYAAAS
jgi:hypothetical protein